MVERNAAYTESMNRLIDSFSKLPGIGRRTAERLAHHLLRSEPGEAQALAQAINDVKANVRHCSICFNLTETDPCGICSDERRRKDQIMVVEQPSDVLHLEKSQAYRGVYHVLLGRLAPLEGVGPGDLTIDALLNRVKQVSEETGQVEVILALNPNMEGDGTSLLLAEQLEKIKGVSLTRLARGLPVGAQLAYANKAVLSDAIHARQKFE